MASIKPGKGDPCSCGSGKTFEKCCMEWYESAKPKVAGKKAAPTAAECNQLEALFSAGRLAELEGRARLLLEKYPESGFVWNLLGASLQMQGKDGLAALQNATKFLPNDADAHSNLGNVLGDLGRLDEAEACYRRALRIDPHNANVLSNLGITLGDLGRLDEAEACYRRALKIKPAIAEVHINLGKILGDSGRLAEAEACYRRALKINSGIAEAHGNLGNIFRKLGRLDEAEACYRQAVRIKPNYAEAHHNLGNILRDMERLDEAEACCRRALEIKPSYVEAYHNLGNVLQKLGQLDKAIACYRRTLEIKPDYVEAYNNLLFGSNYLPNQSPAQLLAEARRYGELVARQARPYKAWNCVPDPARCLRVGIVSGDLRAHPVGYFLKSALAALSAHAAGRLELFAYHNNIRADAVSERIKACCRDWHTVAALSDENLARLIHDDGIDILLDLAGHTAHNRLSVFAWKPAPIQAAWLGYLATTGVAAMDYLIADAWTLPETEEAHFTEKIWRLPETYLCFTPPDVEEKVAPLPALANGYVTFGSFNNLTKMNDDVVALWARVLASIPNSQLFLKTKQFEEASVRQSTVERFAVHGIGADRLVLKEPVPRAEYLAPYRQVDIALDPFPYPGITTSVESLWMGVPVLTLTGESFMSRQGIGLLMNAGLSEWIAIDADDYVAKAIAHAGDLQRLAALHNGLRQQVVASPIFDALRFAKNFEAALRGMWQKWCG